MICKFDKFYRTPDGWVGKLVHAWMDADQMKVWIKRDEEYVTYYLADVVLMEE